MKLMDSIYNLLPHLKVLLVIVAIFSILTLITNGFKFEK